MAETDTHPVYSGTALSWQERMKSGRKFGKYDFGQFERLAGSGHYLGKGKIGDMEVACKFLFRESQWGVLSEAQNPGGVVYLNLDFTEPPGCRLKGATVILTLDDEDDDLREYFSPDTPPKRPKVPVHITTHGPQKIMGQERQALQTIKQSLTPHVDVGGWAGVGGMGRDSQKDLVLRSQWKFSSQPLPNKLGRPTILQWDLCENELDRHSNHSNTFHTAFAFEHDGQPFFMKVDVRGHLEHVGSHLRYKVKRGFQKFKFPAESRTATTLVNFGGRKNKYTTPLDRLAKRLPWDMVQANMKAVALIPEKVSKPEPELEITIEGDEHEDIATTATPLSQNPLVIEEFRNEAMAMISSQCPRIVRQPEADVRERRLRAKQHSSRASVSTASDVSSQAGASIASSTTVVPDQEQSDSVSEAALINAGKANPQDLQRLLEEAGIPYVVRVFILWLLLLGLKLPGPSDKPAKSV